MGHRSLFALVLEESAAHPSTGPHASSVLTHLSPKLEQSMGAQLYPLQ
jgi:hypothetical protein